MFHHFDHFYIRMIFSLLICRSSLPILKSSALLAMHIKVYISYLSVDVYVIIYKLQTMYIIREILHIIIYDTINIIYNKYIIKNKKIQSLIFSSERLKNRRVGSALK